MPATFTRRRVLLGAAGLAVTAGASTTLGVSTAEAASPVGVAVIDRLWGKRTVRTRIPGTRRYRTTRVPVTKNLYEGTHKAVLNKGGLCHWFGTPKLFEDGNCVLFGHRTTSGGPLRNSHRFRVGDPITVTSNGMTLTYTVAEPPLVVGAKDFASVVGWGSPTTPCLTLVTCTLRNKMPTSTRYRLLIRAAASGPASPVTPPIA